MSGNSPSSLASKRRYFSYRRYESAIQLASVVYRGTGDIAGTMKAAEKIRKYLDDAAEQSNSMFDARNEERIAAE